MQVAERYLKSGWQKGQKLSKTGNKARKWQKTVKNLIRNRAGHQLKLKSIQNLTLTIPFSGRNCHKLPKNAINRQKLHQTNNCHNANNPLKISSPLCTFFLQLVAFLPKIIPQSANSIVLGLNGSPHLGSRAELQT